MDTEVIELGTYPSVIRITLRGGSTFEHKVTYPKGHERNPMLEEDVQKKFEESVRGIIPKDAIREIISSSKKLDRLEDVSALF